MADINHTATTPEEFARLFPITGRPFAVWYTTDPDVEGCRWVVNGEDGCAIQEFEDRETAFKMAEDERKPWRDQAEIQALSIAKLRESDPLEEARAGAIACRNQLVDIEQIANQKMRVRGGDGITMEEWWRIHDEAAGVMCIPAGKQGAFISGFLGVIAEYIMCTQEGCRPNLDNWKPEATMTEVEKAAYRLWFEEEINTPA
jgi:hypothetical protein